MTRATPLQLAGAAIKEMFENEKALVTSKALGFECTFPSPLHDDSCAYRLYVDWNRAQLSLEVCLVTSFDVSALQMGVQVGKALQRSLDPFLEDRFEAPGEVVLARMPDGAIVPLFQSNMDYAPLEDEEIPDDFSAHLARGLYILELLEPVFSYMERGYLPTAYERLRMMTASFGLWELNTGSPNRHFVSLPAKLFGGISELRAC